MLGWARHPNGHLGSGLRDGGCRDGWGCQGCETSLHLSWGEDLRSRSRGQDAHGFELVRILRWDLGRGNDW